MCLEGTLLINKQFRYAGDFEAAAGSVVDFILPFVEPAVREYITQHKDNLTLKYFDYDWDLNGATPCSCSKLD